MPIYEYACESCKKDFDHLQRTMTDGPKPACPECGSKKTSRKMSVFAVAADTAKASAPVSGGGCGRCGGVPGSCQM